jgi:glycosyltransferase involved in cell wall biosynthesis
MRLLRVIGSVDPTGGGVVEGLVQQQSALCDRGVATEVVALDPPDAPFLRDQAFPVHALGEGRYEPSRTRRFRFSPRLVPWLSAHVRDYDRVIVDGLWNFASVGGSLVLPGGPTPYFVFAHGMLDPWFRRRYPLKHAMKQGFWWLFEGRLAQGAQRVLFTTEEERTAAERQFLGWRYHGEVVGFGVGEPPCQVAEQRASLRSRIPELGERPFLLFLSRIHPKKGCELLIEGFADVAARQADLQLVMAGPDEVGWTAALKTKAETLGIADRIHWPGMLAGAAKWGAFRSAAAFILPSHQENFGVVVAEALACACPVLISDKINTWREVRADGAGLVETDSRAGVERLIHAFLALPPPAIEAMRAAARQCFVRHFNAQIAADRLLAALQRSD